MASLSADSLETVAQLTGLEGTGKPHSTPMFYRGLIQLTPSLVRTITNVEYNGVDRIPNSGPAILVGNHTSHIDPIIKIMGMIWLSCYAATQLAWFTSLARHYPLLLGD